MYPVARNTFLALSVLLSSGLSGIALDAQTIAWTDWTSATTGNPGSAVGTISSTSSVGVSYNGQILFAQTLGQGIDYWIPSTPFLSTTVTNAPPDSDIIALTGGTTITNTISFSQPVVNPVMAINSLGDPSDTVDYDFNAPFTVLSYGTGYWGGGTLVNVSGNILQGREGTGVIQFAGTLSSISWTVDSYEYWHGFTVGIAGVASGAVPEPGVVALMISTASLGGGVLLRRRRKWLR